MHETYTVRTLRAADVARTYAVIQHLVEAPSLADWEAATATELQRQRWLTVIDQAGVVRGLCYFYVEGRRDACRLEVPVFAAMSLFDERRVAMELLNFARAKARTLGCDSVHFWPAGRREWAEVTGRKRSRPKEGGIIYDLRASGGIVS